MMAFFTMPISRMMPISDHAEIVAERHQRQQYADAGRRQRREDGDGVDETLVEHAQHDVDGEDGGQDQERRRLQRLLEELAMPWNRPSTVGGTLSSSRSLWICSTASPSEWPGARLNEIVTDGNWPWWLMVSGASFSVMRATALSGTGTPLAPGT